ncbi:KpsF/GutQ family sugar-phosphate isomerase [Desulfobaculum bizertense]|uniref:KpsF/GutQ family sugar-phosphate isomerase n=1 Tax=Desulfobaculum bizertense TaxID=376490 RepID=UPI001F2539A1|nr:KpsF/GutQ family sugar-phosphate isomerase [Desulfobaculum bizertense]UIJ36701.1 KpsF/GutQ family sugar-phosphate isomerase [Desulfobaculum bizertense]
MTPKAQERDWLTLGRETLDIEIEGLRRVRDRLNGSFIQALEIMGGCTGRVVVTGIGKSGLVGRKIAATLSSTGTPSFFLHPVEGAHGDLGMLRSEDVVLALSNSGETDELNAILPALRTLGLKVVGITGNLQSTLASLSDVALDSGVEREACPLGLAPTASTTAQLALGDALASCLVTWNRFEKDDFAQRHPGGSLGQRLRACVQHLMHVDDLPTADHTLPFAKALVALDAGGLGALAITDASGVLHGILTDGDVRRMLCSGTPDMNVAVEDVMTSEPLCVRPDVTAAEVLDIMETREVTVIPVVDSEKKLVGMVHLHDLLGKGRLKFSA